MKFGAELETKHLILDVLIHKCGNCGATTTFSILTKREWFMIRSFMLEIPLVPYLKRYELICTECQNHYEISREVGKKLISFRKTTAQRLEKKILDEEYHFALVEHDIFPDEFLPNNDWECPKCKRTNSGITYRCKCGYGV